MTMDAKLAEALKILGITAKRDDLTKFDERLTWFVNGVEHGRYNDAEGFEILRAAVFDENQRRSDEIMNTIDFDYAESFER